MLSPPLPTYQGWLQQAEMQLNQSGDSEARINAKSLLAWVTGESFAKLLAFSERHITLKQQKQLEELLNRRINGEPLAYIIGERDFWTLTLQVSPATLIPRSDTEILVEQGLKLAECFFATNVDKTLRILDLGTGTGAVALALGKELGSRAEILGVDFNPQAVELAENNGRINQINNVRFCYSNWFSAIKSKFNLILSNPPYIDEQDPHLYQGDLRFEPLTALVAKENGLADLRKIIQISPQFLYHQGWLLLEHGFSQGQMVQEIFHHSQNWQNIKTYQDYGHNDRITMAQIKL